jgi:phosphotransferase system HPr-like phosphotransfer protein
VKENLNETLEKELTVLHPEGMNLFICKRVAEVAQELDSRITVFYRNQIVEVIDIFDLLQLGICPGEKIRVKTHGANANHDLKELVSVLCPYCSRFEECHIRNINEWSQL